MDCSVLSDQVTVNDAGVKKEFNFILILENFFLGLPLIINLILTLPESRI